MLLELMRSKENGNDFHPLDTGDCCGYAYICFFGTTC